MILWLAHTLDIVAVSLVEHIRVVPSRSQIRHERTPQLTFKNSVH